MWSLTIIEKGFSYYTMIDINELNIYNNIIDIAWGNSQLWLDKDHSVVTDHSVYYRGDGIEVLLERL